MTALVVICSAVPALWLGYYVGRARATKIPAKRRTRRAALGKWAIRLFALMIVTRLQRSMQRKLSPEWASKLRRSTFAAHLPRLS